MLAVAGGAWALFGRDSSKDNPNAIGPVVPTSAPANPILGPVAPKPTSQKPTASATSTKPVAAPRASAAATKESTPAPVVKPTAAASATKAPVAAPTKAPPVAPVVKPVVTPPVSGPQQTGTVAKKDYTFKVARGDTLWDYTKSVLASTGRSTSNASVSDYVTKLYQSNQKIIGSDPNLIFKGQNIVWPTGL